MVSLPRLSSGSTLAIKHILDRKVLGELTEVRTRLAHDGALKTRQHPQGWLPPSFFDPQQSAGGAMIDLGAHPMYLARLFLVPMQLRRLRADVFHILDHSHGAWVRSLAPDRTVITCHDLIPFARPEMWRTYNARKRKGESLRVFPLSNWTELDVWLYIHLHEIPIVPLYLAAERPVVERDGVLIMVDDDRMPLGPGEEPALRRVRFRTLGCYPLTGAIESDADTLDAIILEMLLATTSERQGRVIDHDGASSMERKKAEGYF